MLNCFIFIGASVVKRLSLSVALQSRSICNRFIRGEPREMSRLAPATSLVAVQNEIILTENEELVPNVIAQEWQRCKLGLIDPTFTFEEQRDCLDSVLYIAGIKREVSIKSHLAQLVGAKPFSLDGMQKALKLLAAKDLLKEGTEDINASAVVYKRHYREEEDVKREHEVSFAGTKEVVPILTLAIEKGNLDAVALLLDAGIDIATQLKRSYRMISISLEKQQLYKLGRDYKQAVKAVKKPDPKKISKSISPPWVPGENTWEPEGTVTSRNPFEQAFNDQNFDLFAIFCQSEQIKNMAGRLELSSDRIPWPKKDGLWPQSFGSLRSLTQLCIHCPRSTGPVPGVIFKLTALTHLELSGCGYTFLSDEIAELVNLQELDVSHTKLTKLPVSKMARMRQLTAVNCAGVKLASPPPEIAKQGPTAVARYILDLDAGTVENTDVLLMLIGDGEAGKTSTLQSLRNTDTNSAEAIGVDDRTIGIDISEFKPFRELPLRFFAWDFGGQAVYAIMQQLFMTRRALYPLLWRVRESLDLSKLNPLLKCDVCRKPLLRPTNATAPPAETKSHTKADSKGERRGTKKGSKIEKAVEPVQRQQAVYRVKGQGLCHAGCISYETLISAWTEHLQFRVPGVTVVLVATHIDCASPEQVDEQCAAVAEVAQRIVSRQRALHTDIPPLRIHNNGQSLRVSNLTGEGVSELREQLRLAAERLDFYGEVMPSSYVQLRKKLREMQARDTEHWRTWITWDDYREVAFKCGIVDADAVKVATRFFHETGELRYFGDSFVTNMSASRMQMRSEGLLNTTVFPNPFWVVDVLRHLIRHDHSEVRAVIAADPKLSKKQIKALDRRVCRLVTNGALHKSLLPYIWQGIAGKFKDASANEDEFHRLIALLQAFDILMVKPHDNSGCDWIVPSLSAGKTARTIDASAFEEDDKMPFVCRMVYDALPPFFDMIFVAHVMNAGSAQSVEFIRGGASFRKFGDRAMVFAGLGKVRDPRQVFRQDQLDENYMHDMLREDQSHVVVTASSRRFLNQLLKDVGRLEEFFPGLQRLGAFFPCYTCRKLRQDRMSRTIAASAKEGQALSPEELGKQQLQLAEENDLKQRKCLAEVAGAKLSTCNEYFDKHKDVLSEAFYTVEPQLQSLVVLGRWFSRGGSMKMSYNSLRKKGCGRYYEEVMKLLVEVRKVMKPTKEESGLQTADVQHAQVAAAEKAVEDRMLQTSELQSAAQLPSLRAVARCCAKNLDALELAWTVCEAAAPLYGSLRSLLAEESDGSIAALDRDQLVPELLYALRKAAELIAPQVKSFFPTSNRVSREAYEQYLQDNALELQILQEEFPSAVAAYEKNFLCAAYGALSSDFQQAHLLLLQELVTLLHAPAVDSVSTGAATEFHATGEEVNAGLLKLQASDAVRLTHLDFARAQDPQFSPLEAALAEFADSKISSVLGKRGADELRYFQLRADAAVHSAWMSSLAPLLNKPAELLGTANASKDNLGWVQHALASFQHKHRALLLCLDTLLTTSKVSLAWAGTFGAAGRVISAVDTHDLAGRSGLESVEALHALHSVMTSVTAAVSLKPHEHDYDVLVNQLLKCEAEEAELWPSSGDAQRRSTLATADQACKDLVSANLVDLLAVWAAIPDFHTILPIGSEGLDTSEGSMRNAFEPSPQSTLLKLLPGSSAFHSAALGLISTVLGALHGVTTERGAQHELQERKTALENEFPEIAIPAARCDGDHYDAMCDTVPGFKDAEDDTFAEGDELGQRLGEWWDRVEQYESSIFYREVILLVTRVQRGASRAEVLEAFTRRADEIEEVKRMEESLRARIVHAAHHKLDLLARSSLKAIEHRTECTHAWEKFHVSILVEARAGAKAALAELEERQQCMMKAWADAIAGVVADTQRRLSICEHYMTSRKESLQLRAKAMVPDVENVLLKYKAQAGTAQIERNKLVSTLRGAIGEKLNAILQESRGAVAKYAALKTARRAEVQRRLQGVLHVFTSRTEEYARLMSLRRQYGPVWYFAEKEDQVPGEMLSAQGSSGERLVEFANVVTAETSCPVDYDYNSTSGENVAPSAQPLDPCVLYISHSTTPVASTLAKMVAAAIAADGVDVRSVCSCDLTTAEERRVALEQAKVLICCIDPDYAANKDRTAEYSLVESLTLDVVPVLFPEFKIVSYQAWWPPSMAFLENHSLFVDMRGASVTQKDRTSAHMKTMLVPTVKQVLLDWAPDKKSLKRAETALSLLSSSSVQSLQDGHSPVAPAPTPSTHAAGGRRKHSLFGGSDSLFVKCEECAIDGINNSVFDRTACQHALDKWKADELTRRSQGTPNDAGIAVCPTEVHCSMSQHPAKVTDILAVRVQRESLPCPRCVTKGILPPFCFPRSVCLAELEVHRSGTMACKRCGDSVTLFDLLRSEVFISYNWGAPCCPDCSDSYWSVQPLSDANNFMCLRCKARWPKTQTKCITQVLVSNLKPHIEEDAGVTCWHDMDRLVGGKDLVREMEAGVRCAEVVVIFLTDAYVRSANCMKEYHFATKHGKYIIPVLLQGYTGVEAVVQALAQGTLAAPSMDLSSPSMDYADCSSPVRAASGDEMMLEWWPEGMSSLRQFKPLVLLREDQTEDVLREICERIQSRFHRSQRYATAEDAVDFLRDYSSWKVARKAFVKENLTKMKKGKVDAYLADLFEAMDRDGSGYLEEDELTAYLDRHVDNTVFTKEQIAALIAEADVDCDGQLSVEEFKAAMLSAAEDERK